jgi:hypothetical protein
MNWFVKIVIALVFISLLFYLVLLKTQIKARDERIVNLEKRISEWNKLVSVKFTFSSRDSAIKELSTKFNLEIDSSGNLIFVKPKHAIGDFYGFELRLDSLDRLSLQEYKP